MRLSGTLLLVLLAAAARAGDPPAPATDSIADAKKDLATLKTPLGQPDAGAMLPTVEMKDLGPIPGGARPESPSLRTPDKEASLDPSKKKEGTGNWLVDAMDKKSDRSSTARGSEKDAILKGDPDLLRPDERLALQGEKGAQSPDDGREKSELKDTVGPVYNPLDSFMGAWISARDHDLLLASPKGGGLAVGAVDRAHADMLPGLDLGQAAAFGESILAFENVAAVGDSRAAANPYLAAFDLAPLSPMRSFAAPDIPGFAPTGFLETARGRSPIGVNPRPLDSTRSFIPDFAQPPDDDKYFKQMKRF